MGVPPQAARHRSVAARLLTIAPIWKSSITASTAGRVLLRRLCYVSNGVYFFTPKKLTCQLPSALTSLHRIKVSFILH